jgi:hypothetical protein
VSLLLLAALAAAQPAAVADAPGPRCEWSEKWRALRLPSFGPEARLVGPQLAKGRIGLPRPKHPRTIEGRWVAQVAIDAKGRTLDATMIERPRVTPPWPEAEEFMLAAARKLRWKPATADGTPVPVCMDLPVFSSPRRID